MAQPAPVLLSVRAVLMRMGAETKPRGEQGSEQSTQTEMESEDEKHQDPELAESSVEEKKDRCEIRFLCASFPLRRLPTRASLFGALSAASRSRSGCLPVVPHHRRSFVQLTCYRKMLLQDFCQACVFRYWAANRGPSGTPLSGVYAPTTPCGVLFNAKLPRTNRLVMGVDFGAACSQVPQRQTYGPL